MPENVLQLYYNWFEGLRQIWNMTNSHSLLMWFERSETKITRKCRWCDKFSISYETFAGTAAQNHELKNSLHRFIQNIQYIHGEISSHSYVMGIIPAISLSLWRLWLRNETISRQREREPRDSVFWLSAHSCRIVWRVFCSTERKLKIDRVRAHKIRSAESRVSLYRVYSYSHHKHKMCLLRAHQRRKTIWEIIRRQNYSIFFFHSIHLIKKNKKSVFRAVRSDLLYSNSCHVCACVFVCPQSLKSNWINASYSFGAVFVDNMQQVFVYMKFSHTKSVPLKKCESVRGANASDERDAESYPFEFICSFLVNRCDQ